MKGDTVMLRTTTRAWLSGAFMMTCLVLLCLGAWSPAHAQPTAAPAYSSNGVPVIEVHGFSSSSNIGCNDSSTFGTIQSYLTAHSWTGGQASVGFYTQDHNCNAYLSTENAHCKGFYDTKLGTNNEDVRHIACTLSWFIWDHYTQNGIAVKVIAHSMGGIVIRQALFDTPYMAQFPPYIIVEDVVTAGTPHQGLPDASAFFFCGSCSQVAQMEYNNPLMANLNSSTFRGGFGNNPQGNGGTDWTTMGSNNDIVLNYLGGSADRGMLNKATHKVKFQNPNYDHGGYLVDANDNWDATASYSDNAGGSWTNTTSFVHAIHLMEEAISSLSW
jgi:triacylglycerol esterase/lipase EstA (alpha/beta hydrolase family)